MTAGPEWWSHDPQLSARAKEISTVVGEVSREVRALTQDEVHAGAIRDCYAQMWEVQPFREYLPRSLGGAEGDAARVLTVLDAVGAESSGLALSVGLTGALFILPVSAFGAGNTGVEALETIAGDRPVLAGMMMTEPHCGTDLFNVRSEARVSSDGSIRLFGQKHWSGLTGHADYWLVFCQNPSAQRRADRMGYMVARSSSDFHVAERYSAWGLEPIPYGRTELRGVHVDEDAWLGCDTPYPSVVSGVLRGSRLTICGMVHGILRGMLSTVQERTTERTVFGTPLRDFDQVRWRIEQMEMAELSTRAMCLYVVDSLEVIRSERRKDFWKAGLIKAWATELMVRSAEHLALLFGGSGYARGSRGVFDWVGTHPWRIFEGPNDVLFDQLATDRAKDAGTTDVRSLLRSVEEVWEDWLSIPDLQVDRQRESVSVGRALAAAIVLKWARDSPKGFSEKELEALESWTRQSVAQELLIFGHTAGLGVSSATLLTG